MGDFELINGDCLEELKHIEDNSIDLVILDLPYGQIDKEWDKPIDLNLLWIQLKRVSKPSTPFFFFTTTKYGYELIKSNEKWFRYDIVWSKPNSSAGFLLSGKMPLRKHEMIYVFYDKLPHYNLADNHTHIDTEKKSKTNNGTCYTTKKTSSVSRKWEPQLPSSILEFEITNKKKNNKHSTQKPLELVKWIIRYYSKKGDRVLDCCMGSGTTGVACIETERLFTGIELNKETFEYACDRIENGEL